MSRRKPDVYLQDILESIGHIQRFLEGVSEEEFYKNVEKQSRQRSGFEGLKLLVKL